MDLHIRSKCSCSKNSTNHRNSACAHPLNSARLSCCYGSRARCGEQGPRQLPQKVVESQTEDSRCTLAETQFPIFQQPRQTHSPSPSFNFSQTLQDTRLNLSPYIKGYYNPNESKFIRFTVLRLYELDKKLSALLHQSFCELQQPFWRGLKLHEHSFFTSLVLQSRIHTTMY